MLTANRKLSLIGLVVSTALIVHASCPVPTLDGWCGFSSQNDDCTTGCCQITGPGQVQRKTCLGTTGTTDCDNNRTPYSYTFVEYVCVSSTNGSYCDHSQLAAKTCLGGGIGNPVVDEVWCNQAVSRSSTNCKNASGGGGV